MVMQKIRRSKKKMRVPLIIMVAVLGFGLIASFAKWSSPDTNNDNASGQTQITPDQQIKNLQLSIDSLGKNLESKPKDYNLLRSLADVRNQQAGLYAQAGNEEKSKEVFAKAIENYLMSLDNAPAELTAQGKAEILVKAAYCASSSNQTGTAGALYQKAIEMAPEDFNSRSQYVVFLALYHQDIKAAKAELTKYKALLKKDDERIAQADQLMKVLEEAEKSAQNQNANKTNNDQTNKTTNGDQQKK